MVNFNFRILSFVLCSFLFSFTSFGQIPYSEWFKKIGGTAEQIGNDVEVDSEGNLYASGSFKGFVDFNPGVSNNGISSISSYDAYVCKYDTLGVFQWVHHYGGGSIQNVKDMVVDDSDNLLIAGWFQSDVDFDPGSSTDYKLASGVADGFISKVNSQGDYQWMKQFKSTGSGYTYVKSMTLDPSGNIFVAGFFNGTTDFDPDTSSYNLTSGDPGDLFICKLDSQGNFLWVKHYHGPHLHTVDISISMDSQGNVVAAGSFYGVVDFNDGPGTFNLTSTTPFGADIFILKLKPNGDYMWARQMGGSNMDMAKDVKLDANNNIYITGSFQGTADFDPGSGVQELETENEFGHNVFVCKLAWNGEFDWVKHFKGFGMLFSAALVLDDSSNVYITGNFWSTVDFNPHPTIWNVVSPEGLDDIFITKLDKDGNFRWAEGFGSTSSDVPTSITIDHEYNVYTTGYFNDTIWSDRDEHEYFDVSLGATDAFIHKLMQSDVEIIEEDTSGIFVEELEWELAIYPNPVENVLIIEFDQTVTNITLNIRNSLGQLISHKKFESFTKIQTQIDGPSGVYILELMTAEGYLKRYKIVKL